MPVFYDDFERANGPLGGNWTAISGGAAISAGLVTGTTNFHACNTTVSDSHRSEAICRVLRPATGSVSGGPIVRMDSSSGNGYALNIDHQAASYVLTIRTQGSALGPSLATATLPATMSPYVTLRLVWLDGELTAYYEGTLYITKTDITYQTQTYCGVCGYLSTGAVMDFTAIGGASPAFLVTPTVIPNYGSPTTVTMTGTNTAWTSGSPGAPVFTVDHGSLSNQTVTSATSATATYDPGTYLGGIVFTDPSTGATSVAVVTSNPAVVPPSGGALSAEAIAYIERSAAAETNATIVNRNEQVNYYAGTRTVSETIETIQSTLADPAYASGGQAGILPLLIQVFDLLNGGADWGGVATVLGNTSLIKTGVDSLATALSDLQGPGGVSLAVLAAALSDLRGTGSPSLADVLAAASGGDSSAVLEAIAAVRGDGSPDLRTLADLAEGMRTVHGYDLASVKSWIDALPQQQSGPTALLILATVAALALAIPSGGASIAAEAVAIGAGPLLDLTTLVEVASLIGTLAGVASDVASIRSSLTTPVNLSAPIWPGLDHATVGASVAIADGLQVAGPLDGLLIHLTTVPAKAGRYAFGDLSSWKYVGAVVFKSDRGDWEWNHPIGLDSQIVTPKAMTHAAAARLRINGGFEGTVRPFTVTA